MGLVNDVRKVNGTAPIGTAPGIAPPAAEPESRLGGDSTALSGVRQHGDYGPAKPPEPAKGFWGGLMDSAKSMWGKVTGIFSSSPPATPKAPVLSGQPSVPAERSGAPATALDPDRAYALAVEAKIQQAKEAAADAAAKWDDPYHEKAQMRKAQRESQQRQENATVPLSDAQQTIVNTFENEDQKTAYKQLSATEREQFDATYQAVGGTWREQNEFAKKASAGVRKLLADGTLLDKDSQDGTLLGTLAAHAGKPLAKSLEGKGLDKGGQLQNIVNTVAYPDSVFQGENTNTCVAASLQTVLAQNDPAELARVATGLIWEGKVKLQAGDEMELSTTELFKQDGGRSSTSALIQGSFRDYAAKFDAEGPEMGGGRYGKGGSHGGGRYKGGGAHGGGRYKGGGTHGGGEYAAETAGTASGKAIGAPVPGGLTEFQAQQLYEHVAGTLAVPVPVGDANRQAAWKGLQAAISGGFAVPAGVTGLDSKGKAILHQVTITKIEGDQAWVADPGTGKGAFFPIAQVMADLNALVLPAQFADHTGWNIKENRENPGDADIEYKGGRYGKGGKGTGG